MMTTSMDSLRVPPNVRRTQFGSTMEMPPSRMRPNARLNEHIFRVEAMADVVNGFTGLESGAKLAKNRFLRSAAGFDTVIQVGEILVGYGINHDYPVSMLNRRKPFRSDLIEPRVCCGVGKRICDAAGV